MFCTNCGSNITDDAVFCTNCGQAVQTDETANTAPITVAEEIPSTPEPTTATEDIPPAPAPITVAEEIPPAPEPTTVAEEIPPAPEPITAAEDIPPASIEEKFVFCANCGAKILEGVKFCGNCGTNTVFSSKPQNNTYQRYVSSAQTKYAAFTKYLDNIGIPKNPSLRWLIIIGAMFIIILIISNLFSNNNKGTKTVTQTQNYQNNTAPSSGGTTAAPSQSAQSSGGTATAPSPTVQVELRPQSQIMFEAVIAYYADAFYNANNELEESSLRVQRKNAIASLNMGYYIEGWVGTLDKLETTTKGKAYIRIKINPNLNVKTINNEFSDMGYDTMIEMDSELFQVLVNLKRGQRVRFSGQLFRDTISGAENDFYKEVSLTIRGAMTDTDFVVKFTDIKPF